MLHFGRHANGRAIAPPLATLLHRMLVHVFGAKASPKCANFALKQTATEFEQLFEPNMLEIVNKLFYVDDCLVSLPSFAEAVTAQTQLCDLFSKRSFRSRKWLPNNSEFLDQIPGRSTLMCCRATLFLKMFLNVFSVFTEMLKSTFLHLT